MMNFLPLPLEGAYLIESQPVEDTRGFFCRLMCQEEFKAHNLQMKFFQVSMSHNSRRGTLRGMHLQVAPHSETKLLRVTAGSLFDVLIDLRSDSSTYLKSWTGILSRENRLQLYIPAGIAHGFQTLEDCTEALYHMDTGFAPAAARSFHYNDPQFGIKWPISHPILSQKDTEAPAFSPELLT